MQHIPMSTLFLPAFFLTSLLSWPCIGLSRFHHSDQFEVDKQEAPGVEYYNDIDSYRYPLRWDLQYQNANHGFRTSAGSLNQTKFYFDEQWKFNAHTSGTKLSVYRKKLQGYTHRLETMEVRWTQMVGSTFSWSIAGEGDIDKKWGDVGFGVAMNSFGPWTLQIRGWSVDHFYNTKNSEHPQDFYSEKPYTWTTHLLYDTEQLMLELDTKHNKPLSLERNSQNYQYQHHSNSGTLHTRFGPEKGHSLHLRSDIELKKESKFHAMTTYKSLNSQRRFIELEWAHTHPSENSWRVGINARREKHQYTQRGLIEAPAPEVDSESEFLSPNVFRREIALFGSYEWLLSDLWFSTGLWIHNPVIVHEDGQTVKTFHTREVKLELAWDIIATKGSHLRLNTTWDLDQVVRDRSDNRPFKPWGGGNIQVMMTLP